MAIASNVRSALERASWIRRMFEAANKLREERGAEAVADLSLCNPCNEPPAAFFDALAAEAQQRTGLRHRYTDERGVSRGARGRRPPHAPSDRPPVRGRRRLHDGRRRRRPERASPRPPRPGRRGDPLEPVLRRVPLLRRELRRRLLHRARGTGSRAS